jgi:hypothetical protein
VTFIGIAICIILFGIGSELSCIKKELKKFHPEKEDVDNRPE